MIDLKPVSNFADLEQFGINCLTGEACVYSMRVLCDLNRRGVALMAEYLGLHVPAPDPALPLGAPFAPNWNSTVNGEPAIGSVMLERHCLTHLARFAMFNAGAIAVVVHDDGSVYPVEDDIRLNRYTEMAATGNHTARILLNLGLSSTEPHVGSRNTHAMSGRTT